MELNKDLISSQSISIQTNPEKIWKTLTDPSLISLYLFGAQTITDWEVGSDILFKISFDDNEFIDKGIVIENRPNELLKYKYWSGFCGLEDIAENYSMVIYEIEPIDQDVCKFRWTQEGFADEQSKENSETSLINILQQIKSISESNM